MMSSLDDIINRLGEGLDETNETTRLLSAGGGIEMKDMKGVLSVFEDISHTEARASRNELQRIIGESGHSSWKADIFHSKGIITTEQLEEVHRQSEDMFHVWKKSIVMNEQRVDSIMQAQAEQLGNMSRLTDDVQGASMETAERNTERSLEKATSERVALTEELQEHEALMKELKNDFEDAQSALKRAEELAESDEILADLHRLVDEAEAGFNRESAVQEGLRTTWNTLDHTVGSLTDSLTEQLEHMKNFKGFGKYDPSALAFRNAATVAEDMAKPMAKVIRTYRKTGDILFDGYQKYIRTFINELDGEAFYRRILGKVGELSEAEMKRMGTTIEKFTAMVRSGATLDELYNATVDVASPTMRLLLSISDEAKYIRSTSEFTALGMFRTGFLWVSWAIKSLVKGAGAFSLGLFETIGRALGGRLGQRIVIAIAEGALASFKFLGEWAATLLGPEVQIIVNTIYAIREAFVSHNLTEWGVKVIGMIPFISLAVDFTGLTMEEYPLTSRPLGVNSKSSKRTDQINLFRMDWEETQTVLDFWGKEYIDEMNKHGHSYPVYKPSTPFKGIMRVPGRYIDLQNHPYEGQNVIDACQEIERKLDYGELIDAHGRLTSKDVGGQIASGLYPRKEGYVRNLVAFPLYENTMHWPSLDGEPAIISGGFLREEIDPTIVHTFELWATQGTWGSIYNSATSTDVRHRARVTNQLDLQRWLKPDKRDPLIWTRVNNWLTNNKGMRFVYSSGMYKVRRELMDKEWVSIDEPTNGQRWSPIGIPGTFYYDTIEGVELHNENVGRYPCSQTARTFYERVVNTGIAYYMKAEHSFGDGNKTWVRYQRKATSHEIVKYKRILHVMTVYRDALLRENDDVEKAWDTFGEEMAWEHYLSSTKGKRTLWGYIQENKVDLLVELECVTKVLLGKRRLNAWTEFTKRISGAHIPMNINSYHRAAFMGSMNQLLYSSSEAMAKDIQASIEKRTGPFVENKLFTTGLSKQDKASWARTIAKASIRIEKMDDLPIYFGNLQCRIIVIQRPKPTLIMLFKGATNWGEAIVDLDFTGAEYGSIEHNGKGEYKMKIFEGKDTSMGGIKQLLFGDAKNFAIHRGFSRGWQSFRKQVLPTCSRLYDKYKIEDVIVSGHSLGAAIAQIACMELPSSRSPSLTSSSSSAILYKRPHAYLFSSPNVGDTRFSMHYQSQVSESVHVYNDLDVVSVVPPFLIPNASQYEKDNENAVKEVEALATTDAGALVNVLAYSQYILHKGIHLPTAFQPYSWFDINGNFSKERVMENIGILYTAWNQHRCVRGGGVFFRLNDTMNDVQETSYDSGISLSAWSSFTNTITRSSKAMNAHSLDTVLTNLNRIARAHPDIFESSNDELPSWGRGGRISPPGRVHPMPNITREAFRQASVIGYAHTKRKYEPWQLVNKADVDEAEMIAIPFRIKDTLRDRSLNRKRIKEEGYTTHDDYL